MNEAIFFQIIILFIVTIASCILILKSRTPERHLSFLAAYNRNFDESTNTEIPAEDIAGYAKELISDAFAPRVIIHTEIEATSIIKQIWTLREGEWNVTQDGSLERDAPIIKYYIKENTICMHANIREDKKYWRIQINNDGCAEIQYLHEKMKRVNKSIALRESSGSRPQ